MQIIWHGQSLFEITSSRGKNNEVKIVIDPFSPEIGLRFPKLEADIVLVTHEHSDHSNPKGVGGNPFLIEGPGEYEIKEVFVQGIPAFHDNSQGKERGAITLFTIETEEMRICHLSDLGQKDLTSEQLEKIGEIDILMVPVGGVVTISAREAMNIMSQIEPKITIPMHYSLPKLKYKIDGVDKFLKAMGIKKIDALNKLTIKKKDLAEDEAKIILLNP
jgi:L-ascorbate metabolism protein UlaG (beta-lactamase superfamily)